jgi:hypothetical protein
MTIIKLPLGGECYKQVTWYVPLYINGTYQLPAYVLDLIDF